MTQHVTSTQRAHATPVDLQAAEPSLACLDEIGKFLKQQAVAYQELRNLVVKSPDESAPTTQKVHDLTMLAGKLNDVTEQLKTAVRDYNHTHGGKLPSPDTDVAALDRALTDEIKRIHADRLKILSVRASHVLNWLSPALACADSRVKGIIDVVRGLATAAHDSEDALSALAPDSMLSILNQMADYRKLSPEQRTECWRQILGLGQGLELLQWLSEAGILAIRQGTDTATNGDARKPEPHKRTPIPTNTTPNIDPVSQQLDSIAPKTASVTNKTTPPQPVTVTGVGPGPRKPDAIQIPDVPTNRREYLRSDLLNDLKSLGNVLNQPKCFGIHGKVDDLLQCKMLLHFIHDLSGQISLSDENQRVAPCLLPSDTTAPREKWIPEIQTMLLRTRNTTEHKRLHNWLSWLHERLGDLTSTIQTQTSKPTPESIAALIVQRKIKIMVTGVERSSEHIEHINRILKKEDRSFLINVILSEKLKSTSMVLLGYNLIIYGRWIAHKHTQMMQGWEGFDRYKTQYCHNINYLQIQEAISKTLTTAGLPDALHQA